MNNKKKNEGQTDFSYYGLYLLDYLRTNRFEQASDDAFIRERADRAAETYERARLEGYPSEGAQELAMDTLLRGLRYSKYAILREVVENEFADEVPGVFTNAKTAKGFVEITPLKASHRTKVEACICENCRIVEFEY